MCPTGSPLTTTTPTPCSGTPRSGLGIQHRDGRPYHQGVHPHPECRELTAPVDCGISITFVSSSFAEDVDDVIRSLKMETDVNEVCFVEAAALVAMVESKLRNPLQVTLGTRRHPGRFSDSGIREGRGHRAESQRCTWLPGL